MSRGKMVDDKQTPASFDDQKKFERKVLNFQRLLQDACSMSKSIFNDLEDVKEDHENLKTAAKLIGIDWFYQDVEKSLVWRDGIRIDTRMLMNSVNKLRAQFNITRAFPF